MSYSRVSEAGTYIWSDEEYMHFNMIEVPENDINIFLARLYDYNREEMYERIELGRKLIEKFKIKKSEDKK